MPSKIARKRTQLFQRFQNIQNFKGSGTDRFRAVDVMLMPRMVTSALPALVSIAWRSLERVLAGAVKIDVKPSPTI